MTVPVKILSYDQTNSPSLTGEANKLDAILNACLVTGFNPRSITSISVANNIATATTSTSHGYQQFDTIVISGANEIVFNDEFTIATVPSTTTFTFPLVTNTSSATGTITCKIAPLGWTQDFTNGSGKSVYHSTDIIGTGLYLRIDDTPAKTALVNMYETMSTVDIGTGKSQDTWWAKSTAASTATHQWFIVGNSKGFYLMTEANLSYPFGCFLYFFGDIVSFRANDPWRCALGGHSATDPNYGSTNTGMIGSNGATTGMCLARASNWLGGYVPFGMYSTPRHTYFGGGTLANGPFPAPLDNACHLFPVYVWEPNLACWRGKMSGLFCSGEYVNGVYPSKDRSVVIDGKTYMAFRLNYTSGTVLGSFWISLDQSDWA